MAEFFDIRSIFFEWLGYQMSYLEFFGTIAGLLAVWLSARANIWSWPIGIINVTLFFFLFYQTQLYPDMFLQVFFFVTNLIGWWRWTHPMVGEEDRKNQLRVSWMPVKMFMVYLLIMVAGTCAFGAFARNLHSIFPQLFKLPSAFPFTDSFITVCSILATYLMVQKKVECWLLWLVADIVAAILYYQKGIMLVSIESILFCGIAAHGFDMWRKEFKSYPT